MPSDLLFFLPSRYEDRRLVTPVRQLHEGDTATVCGEIVRLHRSFRRFEVGIRDSTGELDLVWFQRAGMAARVIRGKHYYASGRVHFHRKRPQMSHPDFLELTARDRLLRVRYSEIQGIAPRTLEKIIHIACESYAEQLVDGLPKEMATKLGLPSLQTALQTIHCLAPDVTPEQLAALNEQRTSAHRRLVFDELFFLQLGLEQQRLIARKLGAPACVGAPESLHDFEQALPFRFTTAQKRVAEQIQQDLMRPTPMNRLLQGDVGCGKTVVALCAAQMVMASGRQVAMMVPTELLAEQHMRSFKPILQELGGASAVLTASTPRANRSPILAHCRSGRLRLLVGTQALLQDSVTFADLALVVVDEQHRFGVAQRAHLRSKGTGMPHLLAMTATPIPRTLAQIVYGDLEISTIDELPPGRRPPETRVVRASQRSQAYGLLKSLARKGTAAYVVCPLIKESESVDLRDAESTYRQLQKAAPELRAVLVTGRTPAEERERLVSRLRNGEIDVLVTTTLIEVGLDIPSATLLIVEHAERFGLAQLHQLRGRVGRGNEPGLCLLIVSDEASPLARKRVDILAHTSDGFRIAEEDLALRGPGDLWGTMQSGLPPLRFADLRKHAEIFTLARSQAQKLLADDRDLDRHPLTQQVLCERWTRHRFGEPA